MTIPNQSAQKIAHNWKVVDNPDSDFIDIEDENGYEMCRISKSKTGLELDRGIAYLIVRAVNSREALLEACKAAIPVVRNDRDRVKPTDWSWNVRQQILNQIESAISLAEKPQ